MPPNNTKIVLNEICVNNSNEKFMIKLVHLCSTNLHWLPIKHCCVYKTVTLVYKLLKIGSCRYFAHFLHLQKACRLVDKV